MSNSADGWTHCDLGHRHWGTVGAAGLLVAETDGVKVSQALPDSRIKRMTIAFC